MDNSILDVVIGLVLVYATLALLVTSLQEALSGSLLRSRVSVLHKLLHEATLQDDALRQRLLANPLVYALSVGETAKPGVVLWRRPTGPSAVPPDVFARALLMEVDAGHAGQHPSERHATPQQFLDSLPATPPGPASAMSGALRGLAVGHETDWPGFEAAIAAWFTHIGDRSEGWFKRRNATWTFWLALLLAAALNVDSFHIASTLASDAQLRVGLADLAERVVAQREGGANADRSVASARPTAIDSPQTRVSARLMDAYNRLRPIYFQDTEIARFEHRLSEVRNSCQIGMLGSSTGTAQAGDNRLGTVQKKFISDAGTWLDLIPALLPYIEMAVAGYLPPEPQPPAGAAVKNTKPVAPGASAAGGVSDSDSDRRLADTLQAAHTCLTHLSAWVRAATTASKDPTSQRAMQEAAIALEDSKSALTTLLQQQRAPLALRRLFQSDPEQYGDCARDASGRGALRQCMEQALGALSRLPLTFSAVNRNAQFCRVKSAKQLDLIEVETGWFGICDGVVDARPAIGLPAMALTTRGSTSWLSWAAGILVTTFFMTLGAPFWFDMLSKLVKLRSSGRQREDEANVRKATGTLPLMPAGTGGAASPAAPPPVFSPAANRFEDQLSKREIIALQQRLGVQPETGVLDATTRLKLRERLREQGIADSDALTPVSYLTLVGRPAAASQVTVAAPGGRPQRRQPHAQVPALASNLMAMLGFDGRIPATEHNYSDDLRALAVLYRYKNDATMPDTGRAVFTLARQNPGALDELDEGLMNEILSSRSVQPQWARDTAPWIDWALGELGQVEANAGGRKTSNPRICEYLDAISSAVGDQGDQTPWCGAFVHWVIQRHNALLPAGGRALAASPPSPEGAANWEAWGTARGNAPPQRGDVVVVKVTGTASGRHVGWCFAVDGDKLWLLGGNQSTGGRVCLSQFSIAGDLAAARTG